MFHSFEITNKIQYGLKIVSIMEEPVRDEIDNEILFVVSLTSLEADC